MMELWLEPWAILAFFVLLGASLYVLISFYICDNQNCKAFNDAGAVATPGTKEYAITVLNGLYNDGIWPIPYIGASILTPLSLWLIGVPITVKTFAIVFLISFIVIFFMFGFFGHHYIKFIRNYVRDYIEDNCPTVSSSARTDSGESVQTENTICEAENHQDFKPFDGLGVTFAPPVNLF